MNRATTQIRATLTALLVAQLAGCMATDPARHMVWEVQGDTNSVYLLGSVHLLRPEDYPLPAVYEQIYAEAEELVMELDMDDLNIPAMQQQMMTAAMIADGRSLREVLGEEAWAIAAATAAAMDFELEMLDAVEPWFAALTLVELQMIRLGFDPSLGVEFYFLRRAQADTKPIAGLESVTEQIAFFDEMPLETQRRFLLKTLDDASSMGSDIDALIEAWRGGNLAAMRNELTRGFDGFPEVYDSLVAARNIAWLDDITGLLDDEVDYLVIVGSLHLVGDDSLVKLLDDRGYRLKRL